VAELNRPRRGFKTGSGCRSLLPNEPMRYFTRKAHDAINEPGSNYMALSREFDNSVKLYRAQLEGLLPRLTEATQTFFRDVSLHDGTLLAMRVGDDIDNGFLGLITLIVT
jgi:hypothetical protein